MTLPATKAVALPMSAQRSQRPIRWGFRAGRSSLMAAA